MTLFNEQLIFGKQQEAKFESLLKGKGVFYIPLHSLKNEPGRGPVLIDEGRSVAAPDYLIFYDNKATFIEYKTKNQWARRLSKTGKKIRCTGVDQKYYDQYIAIKERTMEDFFLIFQHLNEVPTGRFAVEINSPSTIVEYWGKQGKMDMVMYDYECLLPLDIFIK